MPAAPGAPYARSSWRRRVARTGGAKVPGVATERAVLGEDAIARTHPVRLWRPAAPAAALVLAADGEGTESWAARLVALRRPLALIGLESSGLRAAEGYDANADPRARAYLPHVDPPYFRAHMDYAFGVAVPWARARLAAPDAPLIAFGCSNGAVWAASAGLEHREAVAGVAAFSLGVAPRARAGAPPHALVSGRLEPAFDRESTRYARAAPPARARAHPAAAARARPRHVAGRARPRACLAA